MKQIAAIAFLLAAWNLPGKNSANPVVVHEWGTFTSVAGVDGKSLPWAPLAGQADLPCFVYTTRRIQPKGATWGLVRMETPVLYFYAQQPTTISVNVDFPQGTITEWYPRSDAPDNLRVIPRSMKWKDIEVLPQAELTFPTGKSGSHYYAARATDSAPLRIGDQQEKLIFYRGVGNFEVPLRPRITAEGKLEIRNAGFEALPLAIAFENQAGKVGYQVLHDLRETVTLDVPELTGDVATLQQKLSAELVGFGLYPKEAAAMIATWRDSWFEEGMRVFYVMPRAQVDSILPLKTTPEASSVARVFVGRVEVLSPRMRQTLTTAVTTGDSQKLVRIGRFLQAFEPQLATTQNMKVFLPSAEQAILARWGSTACVE